MRRLSLPLALTAAILLSAPGAVSAQSRPEPLLEDLSFPTNMAFAPDGTLFFTEKETGNVRVVTPGGELLGRPLVTLPVVGDAERGLLGIAVHPNFAREPWLYLYLSDAADGRNRLVRVRVAGHVAESAPETLLDGLSAAAGYHNGGDLVFGLDGMLYVSVGEAHEPDRAQDPGDIGGKVLRLTPEGDAPADNPFGDDPAWSIGHRNSFGLCVDPATGELWETENGPDRDDEVNLIEPGANYGWPEVTGSTADDRFRDPVVVFPETIAITGCAVADGDLWFGSFDGRLWRLPRAARARGEAIEVASFPAGVSDVLLGPDGDLYVATADSIWTVEGVSRSSPSASGSATSAAATTEGPTPAPVEEPDDGTSARTWVAAAAFLVLTGALWARFAAGRRLRRQGGSD